MFGTGKTAFDLKTGRGYDIIENEQDLDMLVAMLSGNILGKQKTIDYLREELKKVKDEAYALDEMAKMKEELEEAKADCRRGFPISESEWESIRAWQEKHEVEAHGLDTLDKKIKAGGAIGGTYTYRFIPTSIGTIGICRCGCGEEFEFQSL